MTQKLSHSDERSQLHLAFRTFFQVVSQVGTVVLILDDLQWADRASLEVMEHLLKDRKRSRLLMIGCYRDNEVDDKHGMTKLIKNI